MREIKFRAWDGKRMSIDVSLCHEGCGNWKDEQLMQYTGLKDKNGKEIYEGDVLKWENDAIGKVEWLHDGFVVYFPNWNRAHRRLFGSKKMEVIGNIYENPELLTPQKVD
jgi:hypothetical protein